MANVYYYYSHGEFTYTNNQYAPACSLYEWDPDNPISKGRSIYIELTDDQFILPEDATGLFYGCTNEIFNDMDKWDSTNCTNMSYLFAECRNLKNEGEYYDPVEARTYTAYLNLGFGTGNVTDMSHMFENCLSLEDLSQVNYFDTGNVTDMSYMFSVTDEYEPYNNMTIIDVTDWDTSNVTNMESMFEGCGNIDMVGGIPVSNFDTSNVTNMSSMFNRVRGDLDVSNFDTTNCTDMTAMFAGTNCQDIDISNFVTNNADCSRMFAGSLVQNVNLGEFDLSSTTSIDRMFGFCTQLETVTAAPGTDWTQYDWGEGFHAPFEGCTNISHWDGDETLTHANNTKDGGYFGRGPKKWTQYIVFMRS